MVGGFFLHGLINRHTFPQGQELIRGVHLHGHQKGRMSNYRLMKYDPHPHVSTGFNELKKWGCKRIQFDRYRRTQVYTLIDLK